MQYRGSLALVMLSQFVMSLGTAAGVYFLYLQFGEIEGFDFPEVILCFAIILMAFSLAECFFRGLDTFAGFLGRAEFDRVLCRPRGALYQVLCSTIELTRLGRLVQGMLMLVYALPASGVHWTPVRCAVLAGMVLGGTSLFAALFLTYASICFFTTEGLEFFNIFTDGGREFGRYPFSIYGKWALRFFTYAVPLACVQYYPLCYILGRAPSPAWALTPLAAQLVWLPAALLWRLGIRRYRSTGS
jgi:ABC-2 type transport system permease protein